TEAETKHLGESLGLILIPEWVWFYEIDGEPAAFIILLPDLNDATRDLNGKILPFGWAKMLWRLKTQKIRRGRVPLMGLKKKFTRDRRGMLAPFVLVDAIRSRAVPRGMQEAEYSWILEDNMAMRHILEGLNARIYKTYRVYGKDL
ncbi:MAG TPA: dATP pyrophosphohydrolase, partial [Caulobacteraceae bacterium]